MRVYIEPGPSGNILATIIIGDSYLRAWEANALPGWGKYCHRHGFGLVAFDQDLIPPDHNLWKKATWQKMLIAETFANSDMNIRNVCYLDSDILINQFAPSVFEKCAPDTIGLVSQRKGLPQPLDLTLRRLAFLRHTCYDNKYPLDSSLFMSPKQIFDFHKVPPQNDYACMGLIVFNVDNHHRLMRSWFDKYDRTIDSLTGGGDEPHINYEIQNWGNISWLDYRFQALWIYEIAWKYPFLYDYGRANTALIRECIEASLSTSYFLHFAGSWHESEMWKIGGFFESAQKRTHLEDFQKYSHMPVTGQPVGLVKPNGYQIK